MSAKIRNEVKNLKTVKKVFVLVLTLALLLSTSVAMVFADDDLDFSQWNSHSAYPTDVINTPLFGPVQALVDNKVLTGYPDGTFKPDNLITRAEVAVALTKLTNRTSQHSTAENLYIFSDLADYGWAKGYINIMAQVGIVRGVTDTKFEPGRNISYAELITMLIRTKAGAESVVEGYGVWPENYINYAGMYNILGDVKVTDWYAAATRGDAAKLLYRIMPKDDPDSYETNHAPNER